MRHRIRFTCLLLAGVLSFLFPALLIAQETDGPVVHAVLFYSPTCPHCHEAINNVMLPLMDQYGEQLMVVGIDVSTESGNYLYQNAAAYYEIPENRRGVPTLIYQDTVLVSTMEIQNEFPGLIEKGLAAGGIDWPDFPGLAEVVVNLNSTTTPEPAPTTTLTPTMAVTITSPAASDPQGEILETAVPSAMPLPETPTTESVISTNGNKSALSLEELDPAVMTAKEPAPPPDPVGFLLAWLVVIALAGVMVLAAWQLIRSWSKLDWVEMDLAHSPGRTVLFWALIILGLIVSGYLAYVETMHVTAVCGPVGECNLVQSSSYARLLGVPVAVLGMLFYLAAAALWLLRQVEALRGLAVLGLVALTLFGTLFSIYLTLVELLIIGAICAWCLTSAVVTGLLWVLAATGLMKRPITTVPGRNNLSSP